MARRKSTACEMRDDNYRDYRSVSDYLGGLVAYARQIEASVEQDMGHMPRLPASSGRTQPALKTPSDRRSSQRTLAIYRLVQVESGGDRGFARCRNISDSGVRLELSMPLEVDHTLRVSFSPRNVLSGRVVWKEGNSFGIAFEGEIDSAAVLRKSADELHGDCARAMRLEANLPARVSLDGAKRDTMVMDISLRGVKITHDGTLRRGMTITVILACGAQRDGTVRWSKGALAGVYFSEPFSVDELGSIGTL